MRRTATDAAIKAAQLAYDLADDVPPLCRYCHAERGERCRRHPECSLWERCSRCEREAAEMERGGNRVCVECAHEIDFEEDDDSDAGKVS